MKFCKSCNRSKPFDAFGNNRAKLDGLEYYCRDCRALRNRERIEQRRQIWFADNGPCVDCGNWENLEVDHIDPSTKDTRLRESSGWRIWTWGDKPRLAELAKCVPRCHDCHLIKTLDQRRKTTHGTGQMYQAYKCRCAECRAWKHDSDKKYRQGK